MKNTQIKLNKSSVNSVNFSSAFAPVNLQSIFIGIMLGDGSLYKSSPTSNVRFEISFGQKIRSICITLRRTI
jgi:hypothetical protein